jgi:TolB protein
VTANEIAALLRKGIDAARNGTMDEARAAFEEIVEADPENEKAWFWLASVLDDDARKKVALSTVLHLNPDNERARKILDQIENAERAAKSADEIIPGVPRRTFMLIVGIAGAVIAALVLLVLIISVRNASVAADAEATQNAAIQQAQNAVATNTAAAVAFAQTQAAVTPTQPDLRAVAATLPPTFTPTAAATAVPTQAALPFPAGLTGRLAAWAGRDFDVNGYLPVGTIALENGAFTPSGDQEGRDVSISGDGSRLVYTRFQPAIFDTLITAINVNGTDQQALDERWRDTVRLFSPTQPSFSPSGDAVAFVARPENGNTNQIFVLSLLEVPPGTSPLRQVTNDEASYSQPSFSPDGTRVLAIRDDVNSADAGADVVFLDIATQGRTFLTNDRGTFIESAPQWSADGSQVVFAAAPANEPNNADIALRFISGGAVQLIARDAANDLYPVFSPDGRYIAFASNRSGNFDIFVYDQQTQSLSQLTNTTDDEYIGGWR